MRFQGDETATSSTAGNAIHLLGVTESSIVECWFHKFGAPAIYGAISGSTKAADIKIERCTFYDQLDASSGTTIGSSDIYFNDGFTNILVERCKFRGRATLPVGRSVFFAHSTAAIANQWERCTVRDCDFDGYSRGAVHAADENQDATVRDKIIEVVGNRIKNCVQEGIKLKNIHYAVVRDNYLELCDTTPETAGSLQGSIFVNGSPKCVVSGNLIASSGTDGIRVVGQTSTGSYTTGAGRTGWTIVNNHIVTPDEWGIFVSIDAYEVLVQGNVVTNGSGGIRVTGGTTPPQADHPTGVDVSGNKVRFTTANTDGININECQLVTVTNNSCRECGGFGLIVQNSETAVITGGIYVDNGVGTVNTHGVRVTVTTNATITGVRSSGFDFSTQTHGVSFGSGVTNCVVAGCSLTGNVTAGFSGLPASAMVSGCVGVTNTDEASLTAAADDTTPTVQMARFLVTAANTVPTAITQLDDARTGQVVTIRCGSSTNASTITDGGNFNLSADWTPNVLDTITLYTSNGTTWFELAKSAN
jgi:hypothetical protein